MSGYRGCAFQFGDGGGGDEIHIGSQTGNACIDACLQRKQTDGSINGITIRADGIGGCWCERKMTYIYNKHRSCFISGEWIPD